jgi:hypothetical protein
MERFPRLAAFAVTIAFFANTSRGVSGAAQILEAAAYSKAIHRGHMALRRRSRLNHPTNYFANAGYASGNP